MVRVGTHNNPRINLNGKLFFKLHNFISKWLGAVKRQRGTGFHSAHFPNCTSKLFVYLSIRFPSFSQNSLGFIRKIDRSSRRSEEQFKNCLKSQGWWEKWGVAEICVPTWIGQSMQTLLVFLPSTHFQTTLNTPNRNRMKSWDRFTIVER